MKAIIVDDELTHHRTLKSLLTQQHPEVDILASAQSVQEGCQLIQQHPPDVVFLDVEMPDGTGFDLLKKAGPYHFQVIFMTGHNKHAIRAIKFGALDYLLKPVSAVELAASIGRARQKLEEEVPQRQLQILLETLDRFDIQKLPTQIAISTSKGIYFKKVKDIVRLKADKGYTKFFIAERDKPVIAAVNIGEYEEQFEPYASFMKVHRSHLVNLQFVGRFVKKEGCLYMKDNSKVSVSKSYREELLGRLAYV